MTIERFCQRLGIPRSTYYYWRSAHLAGREVKRWPAPVVDNVALPAAEQAVKFSAWGHRKIWAMLRADGVSVSQSSIYRALKRQGLLQPTRYHAERRALATARRQTFWNPPSRRNRVWQTDFTRMEITSGSVWWISPVTDYYAKVCFAATVSTRTAAGDAIASLQAAIRAAEAMMGRTLPEDCTDPETGEITPVTIVTDNGPCYKSAKFLVFIATHPELAHVRTRHHSPGTNGVVERFNQSLKYEHLYRNEISNGQHLVEEIAAYCDLYNHIRPHESLNFTAPIHTYLARPN